MDARLPTGVVTFLFTDVEGSTKLLHELGDEYAAALHEHRQILRGAFDARRRLTPRVRVTGPVWIPPGERTTIERSRRA